MKLEFLPVHCSYSCVLSNSFLSLYSPFFMQILRDSHSGSKLIG